MMSGQVEQFRIEAEPLDGLLVENNPATLAKEGFEAALGVDKRQPQDDANDFVEQDSREFAERRSEEHTSELQSLTNLVCRLLLEKKKSFSTCISLRGVAFARLWRAGSWPPPRRRPASCVQ